MEKISVAVRFRPSTAIDQAADRYWRIDDNCISLHRGSPLGTPASGVSFTFDHVFDQRSTNATIYDLLIKSLIHAAVDGFNGTAFAYGQTSSGKTFTMNGSLEDPGIIPLAVRDVFKSTKLMKDREFLIRVSFMEIYNEEINDLLTLDNQRLPIHESLERGIYVAGLREEIVNSEDQVLDLLKLGEANRHFGETNMNARSSRSHTIFRMVIESSVKDFMNSGDASHADAIRVSILNLVDLAGSERIAKTGADGVRLKEGKHINKSLMILGNVINKLSENGKQRGHIPYRDSKLTRILQPALGGNAKTSIICTAAPEEIHIEETRGTLQFASRAKRIVNYAQVNEILTDAALLKRQKLEIEELRKKLQGSHSEVLEQMILKQRNDMHKSELERERLAMELEEERKSREALERCIIEQQKMIEDLSNQSVSSRQAGVSPQSKIDPEVIFSEASILQSEAFRTPDFNSSANDFVVRRKNSFREPDWSPIPDNFDNVADEDLWMRLNKGCTTNLDMLQMTPVMKCYAQSSNEIQGHADEDASFALEPEFNFHKQQLEISEEKCAALERECSLVREENASLKNALSTYKAENELLTAQKEDLWNELNIGKHKMKELREEIDRFSLAFSRRDNLVTSVYTKSKAMVDNLRAFQILTPDICNS